MARSWEEMLSNPIEGERLSGLSERLSGLSTLEELEVLVICEDCGSNTEWKDCEKHPEGGCYRVECLTCCWTERDCDHTEHGEIIK